MQQQDVLAMNLSGMTTGALLSLALLTSFAGGADWPQWRGPTRDGVAAAQPAWPDSLGEDHLKQAWRVELSPSYSGPIVANGSVFVTETIDKTDERVRSFKLSDGTEQWSARWPGAISVPFFAKSNGDWIRSTPVTDGTHLYVAGIRDVLVCLDITNGKEKWRVDFVEKLKSPPPAFGFVSSPLLHGDFIYVQAGAAFCKLRKDTGELVWKTLDDGGGMYGSAFSSPVRATIHGQPQLLVQTRQKLAGVDDETGRELWSVNIPTFQGMNILTPTVHENRVFTSAYAGKSLLFEIEKSDSGFAAKELWSSKAQGYMSSPLLIDGHLYLHLRNQRFTCLEWASGKEQWITKPYGKYWSTVRQGSRILALDEKGDLLLTQASPEKFNLLSERHVSDNTTWAHVAVLPGKILVRDLKGLSVYDWQ